MYEKLDNAELLRLALDSINENRHPDALSMLKVMLERDSEHAFATYLLAAEHAQLGMMDRAEEGFERAVKLAPDFVMARFQLGQLYLAAVGGVLNGKAARLLGKNLAIHDDVQLLHITASNEGRYLFPVTSAVRRNGANNQYEVAFPGAHSDIGGGTAGEYSKFALSAAHGFLSKLGVPLKPLGARFTPPSVDTPNLFTHNSDWVNAARNIDRISYKEPRATSQRGR